MSVYSKALRHVDNKDFRKTHQRRLDEQKISRKIEKEQELQERKEVEEIKKLATPLKYDWRSDIFPQEEEPKQIEVVEEIKVNVPEKLKSNWREEFYSVEPEVDEPKEEVIEVPEHLKNNWRKELIEGMSTKDFEYLYGLSIHTLQINSVMGNVENINAQEIVKSSAQTTDYQFGVNFPGSYINSIGDNQIVSQSKVDALAYLDTTYGNVSGDHTSFRLTTGPEGLPPEGQSPPGSVTPRVNLETALGVTLPAGVPNGNLGGTPIEGSAIKRVFTDAKPGKRINFNWSFASSEDALGAATVDDYAFVAIKGQVTKLVSVLTKGLIYNGQFIYTVKPEDIVNGQVEIGIGIMDVYDPYVQTTFNITNFGTFWDAGTLGSTTDAADLGMSVAAATPQSQQRKQNSGDSEAVAAARAEYLRSGQTVAQRQQSYDKLQAAIKASIDAKPTPSSTERNDLSLFNDIKRGIDMYINMLDKLKSDPKRQGDYKYYTRPSMIKAHIEDPKAKLQKLEQEFTKKYGYNPNNISDKSSTPPKPTQPKPQLDKYGRQIGTPLPPGVQQDMERGGKTASPVGDAAIMAAAAALLKGGFKGGASSTETGLQLPAKGSAEWTRMAKEYTRANPGQYNPFMTNAQNQLMQKYGVGTNAMPLKSLKNSYESQGEVILEKKMKTFKQFTQELYPGQPSPNGFPDTPPPEMINGYHPDYGKKSNMYNTLDKESAMSMPLTGDPEIDAKILKARKQPK